MRQFQTLAFALLALTARPALAATNAECLAGGISELSIAAPFWHEPDEVAASRKLLAGRPSLIDRYAKLGNLCELPVKSLPKEIQGLPGQLRDLNLEAARRLGAPTIQAVVGGLLSIRVDESPWGGHGGRSNGTTIMPTVFPSWGLPGHPHALDAGVYLHELGHVVANSSSHFVPKFADHLDWSPLLTEGMPDLLAFGIVDAGFSNADGLPACFTRTSRMHSPFTTYADLLVYGTRIGIPEQVLACCRRQSASAQTAEMRMLCAQAKASIESDPRRARPPTEELLRTLLDGHNFGTPLSLFFSELGKATGTFPLGLVFRAASQLQKSRATTAYACSIPAMSTWVKPIALRASTVTDLVAALRETLDARGQRAFDTLSARHDLARGLLLDAKLWSSRVADQPAAQALNSLAERVNQAPGSAEVADRLWATKCYQGSREQPVATWKFKGYFMTACAVTCELR